MKRETKRGELRRAAMLDAATDLFLVHGYDGTSLEIVIERAGGSRRIAEPTHVYRVTSGHSGEAARSVARDEGGARDEDDRAIRRFFGLPDARLEPRSP